MEYKIGDRIRFAFTYREVVRPGIGIIINIPNEDGVEIYPEKPIDNEPVKRSWFIYHREILGRICKCKLKRKREELECHTK